jgi:hypothetical protein
VIIILFVHLCFFHDCLLTLDFVQMIFIFFFADLFSIVVDNLRSASALLTFGASHRLLAETNARSISHRHNSGHIQLGQQQGR